MRFIYLVLSLILFISCGYATETHTWVPDNDLWQEDNINFVSNIDEGLFGLIIDIGKELYEPTAKDWNETLSISKSWDSPIVNASAWRNGAGNTEIMMYGGLARREEVIPQGFALVLCHELNHLYGGEPYIHTYLKMAAEGQSDWMGASWCLKNIVEKLKSTYGIETTPYMQQMCNDDPVCLQQLAGGNSLGKLLAELGGESVPDYETPDPSIVKKTNTSYPKTTQCRLDSYHNGALGLDRPLCWYKPPEKKKKEPKDN